MTPVYPPPIQKLYYQPQIIPQTQQIYPMVQIRRVIQPIPQKGTQPIQLAVPIGPLQTVAEPLASSMPITQLLIRNQLIIIIIKRKKSRFL